MDALKCVGCGTHYTIERETSWGRTKDSDGNGPRPICTAIVPAPYAKKVKGTGEIPGQRCGHSLVPVIISDQERAALGAKMVLEQEIVAGKKIGRR